MTTAIEVIPPRPSQGTLAQIPPAFLASDALDDPGFARSWRRPPALPATYVWGLYGGRGQGKTAGAVHQAYQAWRHQGRRVLYWPHQLQLDFHKTIRPEYRNYMPPVEPISLLEISRLDDRLNNAFAIFDEVHMILPSNRASAMASSQIVGFLTQIRKRGSWLVWTTNSPNAVNRLLLDQTDVHGKCFGGQYIKRSNSVGIRIKDTQGRYSPGNDGYIGRMDVRRTAFFWIRNISFVFTLYNTNAIADPAEVWELSKDVVLNKRAEERDQAAAGMSMEEIAEVAVKGIVAIVTEEGATELSALGLAKYISETYNTKIPDSLLGRVMGQLGLPIKSKTGTGNYRILPPADMLEAWQQGRYMPREEDHAG